MHQFHRPKPLLFPTGFNIQEIKKMETVQDALGAFAVLRGFSFCSADLLSAGEPELDLSLSRTRFARACRLRLKSIFCRFCLLLLLPIQPSPVSMNYCEKSNILI
jgi:hypothetical protein